MSAATRNLPESNRSRRNAFWHGFLSAELSHVEIKREVTRQQFVETKREAIRSMNDYLPLVQILNHRRQGCGVFLKWQP